MLRSRALAAEMEIGFVTAFLCGALALLSPCSALLLPAFFSSTVGARVRLVVHGTVFYFGLVLTLVPFGLGLGAFGTLFITQRGLIIAITSIVLVVLGIAQILGIGFDLSRFVPGAHALHQKAHARTGLVRTLLLGAVSGIAGFCAGPILGAVLTLAIGQGSTWAAGALLAVYAAGMVVPLVVIAALWERLGTRGRALLRGRTFTILGRELHTTSVITGLLILSVGIVFWTTNGLVGVPALIPTDVQTWAQERSSLLANPLFDILAILAIAAIVLTVWDLRRRRRLRQQTNQHPDTARRT